MLLLNLIILLCVTSRFSDISEASESLSIKILNYRGSGLAKNGEVDKKETFNETLSIEEDEEEVISPEAEAACWKLINEQSVKTFSLQNKVLDELDLDLRNLNISQELRAAVEKITTSLRGNMKNAIGALENDHADEYFDSLFEASEEIIYLSNIVRDPTLDEPIFLTLIKAVSRLGRNNAALIQQFIDMCPLIRRAPTKPRQSSLG